jgi:hypothetical protein
MEVSTREEARGAPGAPPAEWEGHVLRANTHLPAENLADGDGPAHAWRAPALWAQWVIATSTGWLISGAFSGLVLGVAGQRALLAIEVVEYLCSVLIAGLQGLVLRHVLPRSWRWVPVTVAGVAVGLAAWIATQALIRAASGGPQPVPEALARVWIEGFAVSAAQWLLLRREVRSAWRWLPVNVLWIAPLSLLAAGGVAGTLRVLPGGDDVLALVLASGLYSLAIGVVASAITGAGLVLLLRSVNADR